MAEENSELTTLSDPELTREEYLERDEWTLMYNFEKLLKEDKRLAAKFLVWAFNEYDKAK